MHDPRYLPLGDSALLIEFGNVIDKAIGAAVLALDDAVQAAKLPGVVETAPSFRSLMIVFDPLLTDHASIQSAIPGLLASTGSPTHSGRLWRLPICYGGEFGPDLSAISQATGLSEQAVVAAHQEVTHFVYMIGFLPGHPYLGDLPPALTLPRRQNPRVRVPRGSVAIAIGLTVIYPVESPGGWNIIGRTPVSLFDVSADSPSLMAPGDQVRFAPISSEEFLDLSAQAALGNIQLEPEAAA